ncbi:uncharacterized protein [Watersipora subatra]
MVIDCWQFAIMMSLVVVLLMVPIVSWAIRRRLRENKAKTTAVPPLMYITTVTDARTIDVDIPHLPAVGESNFLPPSYEDICTRAQGDHHLSISSTSLNMDDDDLPEYGAAVRLSGSMVLSTFYNDSNSVRTADETDKDSAREVSEETSETDEQVHQESRTDMGVFVA